MSGDVHIDNVTSGTMAAPPSVYYSISVAKGLTQNAQDHLKGQIVLVLDLDRSISQIYWEGRNFWKELSFSLTMSRWKAFSLVYSHCMDVVGVNNMFRNCQFTAVIVRRSCFSFTMSRSLLQPE